MGWGGGGVRVGLWSACRTAHCSTTPTGILYKLSGALYAGVTSGGSAARGWGVARFGPVLSEQHLLSCCRCGGAKAWRHARRGMASHVRHTRQQTGWTSADKVRRVVASWPLEHRRRGERFHTDSSCQKARFFNINIFFGFSFHTHSLSFSIIDSLFRARQSATQRASRGASPRRTDNASAAHAPCGAPSSACRRAAGAGTRLPCTACCASSPDS